MLADARLRELLAGFETVRVAVLGDFFLDRYLDTDPALAETSVETGRVAHQVVSVQNSAGAAGTVVNNLSSLGVATLYAVGAIGRDGNGFELEKSLQAIGCSVEHLHAFDGMLTPTYLKPRDATRRGLAGEHDRYDTKNRGRRDERVTRRVQQSLEAVIEDLDAVVVSDQIRTREGGLIDDDLRQGLCRLAAAHPQVRFLVDSRFHIDRFVGMWAKPNQFEAIGRAFPGPDESVSAQQLETAVAALYRTTGTTVVCTRGAAGVLLYDGQSTWLPALAVAEPTDPTGAGDSFSAGLIASFCSGGTPVEAAVVGILASGITVSQLDTTGTARPEEIVEALGKYSSPPAGCS